MSDQRQDGHRPLDVLCDLLDARIHVYVGTEIEPQVVLADDILAALRSLPVEQRMAAMGMETAGWYGVEWDGATALDTDEEPAEDEAVVESEGARWVYCPGEWSMRHEDGSGELINPKPLWKEIDGV